MYCGIKPAEFWELTPAELNLIIENYTLKTSEDFKTSVTIAYYNAYFQRVAKMPKLEKVLKDLEGKKEMDDNAMLRMVQELHKAFGGV